MDYVTSPGHWLSGYVATRALANAAESGTLLIKGLLLVPGELVGKDDIDAVIARQQSDQMVAAALTPVGDNILAHADKYIVGPWPPK